MGDRQLNQYAYHQLRVDRARLLSAGYLWDYSPGSFILQAGQTGSMSLLTGDFPVLWSSAAVLSASASAGSDSGWTSIDVYAGGTLSGGEARTGLPLNHNRPLPSPLAEFNFDVNVDVPGTLVSSAVVAPGGESNVANIAVLAEKQLYYITFDNVVPPSVAFEGPWDYQVTNGLPNPGIATHTLNGQTMRFSHTDSDSADRRLDLLGVEVGTFILRDDGETWEVISVLQDLLYSEFSVTPGNNAPPDGIYTFEFRISTPGDTYLSVDLEFGALPPSDLF